MTHRLSPTVFRPRTLLRSRLRPTAGAQRRRDGGGGTHADSARRHRGAEAASTTSERQRIRERLGDRPRALRARMEAVMGDPLGMLDGASPYVLQIDHDGSGLGGDPLDRVVVAGDDRPNLAGGRQRESGRRAGGGRSTVGRAGTRGRWERVDAWRGGHEHDGARIRQRSRPSSRRSRSKDSTGTCATRSFTLNQTVTTSGSQRDRLRGCSTSASASVLPGRPRS